MVWEATSMKGFKDLYSLTMAYYLRYQDEIHGPAVRLCAGVTGL